MPDSLCGACYQAALAAVHFKRLCATSQDKWFEVTYYLTELQTLDADGKTYFVLYEDKTIIKDKKLKTDKITEALNKLNGIRQEPRTNRSMRKYPKTKSIIYKCPDCGKKFTSSQYLNSHLRTTLKSACSVCGRVVPKRNLRDHLTNKHGMFTTDCPLCIEVFLDESEYMRHCKEKHSPGSRNCAYCRCSFSNERALAGHMYAHTLFNCPNCRAAFENRKCYIYHRKLCIASKSTQQELFKCDYCGIEYDKKPSLRIHILHKHLNTQQYICQICGKSTSTKAHLESHELIHKNERTEILCYCGSKFRTDIGYKMHLRIHSGEKPYQCKICGDRFLSASRRSDHIKRRHKSEMDAHHACENCPATFIRPWELRKHYLTVHCIVKQHIERKQETMRRFKTNC